MAWYDGILNNIAGRIASQINLDERGKMQTVLYNYYSGKHRPQLKTEIGKQDDNIYQNWVGLAVDRSVSRLFRGGITFVTPKGAEQQQQYLDYVWDANKKEIVLFQLGLHGAVDGNAYAKISPNGLIDPYTNQPIPRLIAIDPDVIRVVTNPHDMNMVMQYVIDYQVKGDHYREYTRRAGFQQYAPDMQMGVALPQDDATLVDNEYWIVEQWEKHGSAPWQLESSIIWEYNFPPIHHWKNLPSLKSCYGTSDIEDIIGVQDKSNFTVSNTGKIIKYHAHPQTVGTGFSAKQLEKIDGAVGAFHAVSNPDAKVYNLEMNSDLASSRAFANDIRQSIFDLAREIDITSVADKLGALTNFGLRVLWGDAMDKNDTKRQLYGDAIIEINRRLLLLAGYSTEASNPGTVRWGEAMPINEMEELNADSLALSMGIVDKQTLAEKWSKRYGKTWDEIQANNAQAQASSGNNVNAALSQFFAGR